MTKTISNPSTDIPQAAKEKPLKSANKQKSPSMNSVAATSSKSTKPAKKAWWKFWAKKPSVAKTEPVKPIKSVNKSNVAETKAPQVEKQDSRDFRALTGRGSSNNLASVTPQREIEDPMIRAFNELKASNATLNATLADIAKHLKSSAVRDEKMVTALQQVDQSVAQTATAIATSADKTDQSLGRLNDHIVYSTNAFSGIVERVESNDTQNRKMMTSLQKRSNMVMIGLGVTIVTTAITLSVLHLVMG